MFGYSIGRIASRVSPELVALGRALPVAVVSDSMARMSAGGPRLRPMHAGGVLAGPAFTVKTRPGDNLMVHRALDIAEPGDVVVVDAGGDLTNAIVGEIMIAYAEARGLAGLIINGAIRDTDAVGQGNFPVYAAGVTHRGPYRDGPGEIGGPIALDGMVINPGDLVLGDADGILAVPAAEAHSILAAARTKKDAEDMTLAKVRSGQSIDRSWILTSLERSGVRDDG